MVNSNVVIRNGLMIMYDLIIALVISSITIMILIGVIFQEEVADYWVIVAWLSSFLIGMKIGALL